MAKPKTYRPSPAAAAALERLTADGRSETSVINELLEIAGREALPARVADLEAEAVIQRAEIAAIKARLKVLEER